jgi:hypothetical protein
MGFNRYISPEKRTETVIPKAAAPVTKGPKRRKCQTQAPTLSYSKEELMNAQNYSSLGLRYCNNSYHQNKLLCTTPFFPFYSFSCYNDIKPFFEHKAALYPNLAAFWREQIISARNVHSIWEQSYYLCFAKN